MRLTEADFLATNGMRLASLYLFGYAAEMTIKAAYFRVEGFGDNDPIGMPQLRAAQSRGATLGLPKARNFHDLSWWGGLLVECRLAMGRPFSASLANQLFSHISKIDRNWRETLRYQSNRPRPSELQESRNTASWLVKHFRYLG